MHDTEKTIPPNIVLHVFCFLFFIASVFVSVLCCLSICDMSQGTVNKYGSSKSDTTGSIICHSQVRSVVVFQLSLFPSL